MKKTLLALVLCLSVSAAFAKTGDTTSRQTPPVAQSQPQGPQEGYKVFIMKESVAQGVFSAMGVCPGDYKGAYSLNELKENFKYQYNNQPQLPADTTSVKPVAAPKKKKK